jgi:hypothetical protein
MDSRQAIQLNLDMSAYVASAYLADLTDADLLHRPCPGANHIAWQLGHLIVAEHDLIDKVCPGTMPALPAGFRERYTKETAGSESPSQFDTKADLMKAFETQRAGTLKNLSNQKDSDFDRDTGVDYAPTVGSMFSLQGSHWMMHGGQWAVIRRQLGRPPLF